MKFVKTLAVILAVSASSLGTAYANTTVSKCRMSMEQLLISKTQQRLAEPSSFELKSVGWYADANKDVNKDFYSMVVYYKDVRTDRTGMTTATVLANSTECKLIKTTFMLFDRRQ